MFITDDYETSFIHIEELVNEVNLEDFTVNTTVPTEELPAEN